MLSWYHNLLADATSCAYMIPFRYNTVSEMFQLDKAKIATRAYLMINCQDGCESHVFDELKTFPAIVEAELTIGRHDILALIETSSPDELRDIIVQKIRRIPEICCTTTLVCTEPGI